MTITAPQRLPPAARLVLGVLALVVAGVAYWREGASSDTHVDSHASVPQATGGHAAAQDAELAADPALLAAIRDHQSGVWIEADARVVKLLADDTDGAEHQRFLVDVAGHSLLVAHNTDLAPRVPLERGDSIRVRARYEWNERGGVLHWTHRDPERPGRGGWIRASDALYE